jgi:ribosomal protein L32
MTIKHKCGKKIVSNKATFETVTHKSYHENFHYDGDGWSHWDELYFVIQKCRVCGEYHRFKENDLR